MFFKSGKPSSLIDVALFKLSKFCLNQGALMVQVVDQQGIGWAPAGLVHLLVFRAVTVSGNVTEKHWRVVHWSGATCIYSTGWLIIKGIPALTKSAWRNHGIFRVSAILVIFIEQQFAKVSKTSIFKFWNSYFSSYSEGWLPFTSKVQHSLCICAYPCRIMLLGL